jgi:DtxR family Mn-dependent transcriptional regulator
MVSRNEQDYLRYIYELQSKKDGPVNASEIAKALGISKPSVSEMMLKLRRSGLVEYRAYGPISLTENGIAEARVVLRRHRLLEVFFAKLLGLSKSFHREAHEIEHALSADAEAKLAQLLKHPTKCPDGDPIPEKTVRVLTLNEAPMNRELRVLFSKLGKREEIDRIKALGIIHGENAVILKRVSGGPLIFRIKGSEVALSKDISSCIYVEVAK